MPKTSPIPVKVTSAARKSAALAHAAECSVLQAVGRCHWKINHTSVSIFLVKPRAVVLLIAKLLYV
jgi:hypothetical protein